MKRNWSLAILSLAVCCPIQMVQARPAKCLLQVDGRNFINRTCKYAADPDGSFTIGVDKTPMTFFAYLNKTDDGSMDGSWNGVDRESHAHQSLGKLKRDVNDPACWVNPHATVCAW